MPIYVCENVDKYDNFVDNSGPPAIAACSIYLVCTLYEYKCNKKRYFRIVWYNRSNY